MKNFIFISPNFPANYWKFCRELQNDGFNVLGIGDCPYDCLSVELKNSLREYYWVSNLENYDEVFRAVAFFTFKYGKIDYLESNNEYWLERDALLRTEFNISSGFKTKDMRKVKYKSRMKKFYQKAGIRTAKFYLVKSPSGCEKFIAEVGYPVIVKPDNGVGASKTYRLNNDADLKSFLDKNPKGYVMEEYIDGVVNSYDAIIDGKGNPVFETGLVELGSLMDIVNDNDNSCYYYLNNPLDDVRAAGRKAVKAFGVKNRFVHFEFFRLSSDQRIGKKGDLIGLEVNMRPAGGCSPDMMNYANSTDVYKIWADTIAYGGTNVELNEKYYCAYAGRRNGKPFLYSEQDILDKFKDNVKTIWHVPDALSGAMGNLSFIATFKTKEEMLEFVDEVVREK